MADLIIKPSSGNLVLMDDQNAEKFKIATSTGNITHTGNIALGTVTAGTLNSGVTNNAGPVVKIGGASFSGVTEVELGQDLGTYPIHKLYITAYNSNDTNGVDLFALFKIGGSWVTTGTEYNYIYSGMNSNSDAISGHGFQLQNAWQLTRDGFRDSQKASWDITLFNMIANSTQDVVTAHWKEVGSQHDHADRVIVTEGGLNFTNNGTIQDIKFYPNESQSATGSWSLYGITG